MPNQGLARKGGQRGPVGGFALEKRLGLLVRVRGGGAGWVHKI